MATRLPRVMVTAETAPTIAGQGTAATAPSVLVPSCAPKADRKKRSARAKPAALGPTERKAVKGVGAPSYTSGHHMWNGTAAILYPTPAATKTMPTTTASRAPARAGPAPE